MRRRREITAAADRLLAAAKVQKEPVPIETLAKLAGATVRRGALPSDLSGFLLKEGKRTIIGVNVAHSQTRQRFTIAHELGHLLLHPGASYVERGYPIYFRDDRSSSAEIRAEVEANQFAADLLMPRQLLDRLITDPVDIVGDDTKIRRLAARLEVSVQALVFRLTNLGLTSPTEEKRSSKPARTGSD